MYNSLHPLLLIKPSERWVEGRVNFLTIKLAAFDYFIAADWDGFSYELASLSLNFWLSR